MRVTMLGVNSAFAVGEFNEDGLYNAKFQSNFLFDFQNATIGCGNKILRKEKVLRILLDAGGDVRHPLKRERLTSANIHGVYTSHPHSDHIGGIEYLALTTFFNPFYTKSKKEALDLTDPNPVLKYVREHGDLPREWKPLFLGEKSVLEDVWKAYIPGLDTLEGVRKPTLSTYFDVIDMNHEEMWIEEVMPDNTVKKWIFYTIESTHVVSGTKHMNSFGLFFELKDKDLNIYFPTDTMLMMPPSMKHFYDKAHFVYQDTETGIRSGVHSHIDDIKKVDPEIKKKLYLYHYNEEPIVEPGEFAGVLRAGDVHEY